MLCFSHTALKNAVKKSVKSKFKSDVSDVGVCVCVYVCVCVCVHVYIHMCLHMCVPVWTCLFVFARRVCVCMGLGGVGLGGAHLCFCKTRMLVLLRQVCVMQVSLDNQKASQKEKDTVAVRLALQKARDAKPRQAAPRKVHTSHTHTPLACPLLLYLHVICWCFIFISIREVSS